MQRNDLAAFTCQIGSKSEYSMSLSGLRYLHQTLWVFKACSIVLNARSMLTLEELNFTDEQCDACVYKLVKYIAMM